MSPRNPGECDVADLQGVFLWRTVDVDQYGVAHIAFPANTPPLNALHELYAGIAEALERRGIAPAPASSAAAGTLDP